MQAIAEPPSMGGFFVSGDGPRRDRLPDRSGGWYDAASRGAFSSAG
jgi:hypothetical protein